MKGAACDEQDNRGHGISDNGEETPTAGSTLASSVAMDSFIEIRDRRAYYVDKTPLIDEILKRKGKIILITRPRRFGKTINISMLDAYLNEAYAGDPDRFEGLMISGIRPDDPEKNAYPVIHMDLSNLDTADPEEFLNDLSFRMGEVYAMFPELETSDRLSTREKALYSRVCDRTRDRAVLKSSLRMLCELLRKDRGSKVVLLIDEYDNAVNEAESPSFRKEVLRFYSDFIGRALKGNTSLEFAVLTGVMQIAKASLFSKLNSLTVDSVFETELGGYFGFTENEVRALCADYGHPERFEEAKQWYDGYRFGGRDVYNPWSVMRYVVSGFVPDTYWANTGSDSILRKLYRRVTMENLGRFYRLRTGERIEVELDRTMTYEDAFNDDDSIFSLMVMTGYLNAYGSKEGQYSVAIPNAEIASVMDRMLDRMTVTDARAFNRFCAAMVDGDPETIERDLGNALVQGSFWKLKDEDSYELVIMTMLVPLSRSYEIRIEPEQGNGRADIVMRPLRKGLYPVIIELKDVGKDGIDYLEKASDAALSQIRKRRYDLGLKGTVLLYGVAIAGKIPRVKQERSEDRHRLLPSPGSGSRSDAGTGTGTGSYSART